ncbi:hypothetical protein [Myxococcus fulvus]|uniref:hypothetical protein n=1 Tax=Myxococcus TaxID=32 RepID=UPI0020C14F9E|nr:hypothetical protein [Myxococcus fulvus]MCK8499298.1 hypothetical protein [Myxococcus fulvus]
MSDSDFGRARGATCPLHPDDLAQRTCTRCGNFMCDTCSERGTQSHCPPCRAREGLGRDFPLDRDNWSFSRLFDVCLDAFKREWVMLSVGALLVFAASMGGNLLSQMFSFIGAATESVVAMVMTTLVGIALTWVIQGAVTLGYLRMAMDVLQGQRADLARVFSQFSKLGTYLLTMLLTFALVLPLVLVGLGILVAIFVAGAGISLAELNSLSEFDGAMRGVSPGLIGLMVLVSAVLYLGPGLWLMLPLVLVQPALADQENPTALETLRLAYVHAKGFRLSIFGVLALGGFIVLLGFILCCLPALPAMGLFQLLLAGLYLAISRGGRQERFG